MPQRQLVSDLSEFPARDEAGLGQSVLRDLAAGVEADPPARRYHDRNDGNEKVSVGQRAQFRTIIAVVSHWQPLASAPPLRSASVPNLYVNPAVNATDENWLACMKYAVVVDVFVCRLWRVLVHGTPLSSL